MTFLKLPGKDFEMADAPVTQKEWREVMGTDPSYFKGEDRPVENVSYDDALEFIEKLNNQKEWIYRLPTEEEWEYACRAGSTTNYCFGDDEEQLKDYAWYWENSDKQTHPVKQKKSNAWGFFDIHGNVWEWTSSIYSGSYRVIRGGSWRNNAVNLRSAYRCNDSPSLRLNDLGFRLVLEPYSLPYNPLTPLMLMKQLIWQLSFI